MNSDQVKVEAGWLDETPLGCVLVALEKGSVRYIQLNVDDPKSWLAARYPEVTFDSDAVKNLLEDLNTYFTGTEPDILSKWVVSEDCSPTPFLKSVYNTLQQIKPGETITYGELAARSGHPGAARAVGTAMARNPVPILIPCHRVITSAGCLGGFTGGLELKRILMKIEGIEPPPEF